MSCYSGENVCLGVDLGSTAIKLVGVNDQGEFSWSHLIPTNPNSIQQSSQVKIQQLVGKNIKSVCATGYGRNNLSWADSITTEIFCQARGVVDIFNDVETIIDIGGQDTKIIRIKNSRVVNFQMNDKCAAGTGRFIEKVASILNCPLQEMSKMASGESSLLSINSMCAIFAETEVVSLIAQGKNVEQIVNSLYYSLASRIANSVKGFGLKEKVALTGGLGGHKCLVYWLEQLLGCKVLVPAISQYSAAYGAALLARDLAEKRLRK